MEINSLDNQEAQHRKAQHINNMPPCIADDHCDASLSRPLSRRPLHQQQATTKSSDVESRDGLLQHAAVELEAMRSHPSVEKRGSNNSLSSNGSNTSSNSASSRSTLEEPERSFPPACLHLLHTLPGNSRCHDCHDSSASWASVSYGITMCLQCSGKHRGLGVNCSKVKSLTLDSWKRREILCMLEGGNEQLKGFFDRHGMGGGDTPNNNTNGDVNTSVGVIDRYRTKAASFYRQHLMSHAKQLAEGGVYKGREASRKSNKQRKVAKTKTANSGNNHKRRKSTELRRVSEEETLEPACCTDGA